MHDKSFYINLLAVKSKTANHELIEKCLLFYGYQGTKELSIEELHIFCELENLL
ncbi:MAG: hypothetical protein IJN64_14080 [Lachnospiraceae bacterium]|nr:hypothetical protein [Lachnospiraceae bacterium]